MTNCITLTEEQKIGFLPTNEGCATWMRLWTDVLEEFVIRFGPYPAGFDDSFMKDVVPPNFKWPYSATAIKKVKDLNLEMGKCFVKFGKYKHLEKTIASGRIRFTGASSYQDPSLNHAIRDSELKIEIHAHPSTVTLTVIDERSGKPKRQIEPIGNITFAQETSTDYYVYCLAQAFSPRLIGDFEADSMIVIQKPGEFLTRIMVALKNEMMHGWSFDNKNVRYVDPLRSNRNDLDVFFNKHFRYAYQREYRIICLPKERIKKLDPIFVHVNGLREIATLVRC